MKRLRKFTAIQCHRPRCAVPPAVPPRSAARLAPFNSLDALDSGGMVKVAEHPSAASAALFEKRTHGE